MDSVIGTKTIIAGEGEGGGYLCIVHHGGCSPQTLPRFFKLLLIQTPAVTMFSLMKYL